MTNEYNYRILLTYITIERYQRGNITNIKKRTKNNLHAHKRLSMYSYVSVIRY